MKKIKTMNKIAPIGLEQLSAERAGLLLGGLKLSLSFLILLFPF